MKKQRSSRILTGTLIICLCLVSLIILPMANITGMSMAEVYEIDFDHNSQLEQTDFDEEFLIDSFTNSSLSGLMSAHSRSAHLDNPASSLSPDSPPPKIS